MRRTRERRERERLVLNLFEKWLEKSTMEKWLEKSTMKKWLEKSTMTIKVTSRTTE